MTKHFWAAGTQPTLLTVDAVTVSDQQEANTRPAVSFIIAIKSHNTLKRRAKRWSVSSCRLYCFLWALLWSFPQKYNQNPAYLIAFFIAWKMFESPLIEMCALNTKTRHGLCFVNMNEYINWGRWSSPSFPWVAYLHWCSVWMTLIDWIE